MSLLVMRQGATLSLPSGLSLRKRLTTVTTRRRTASSSQRAISIPPKDPREAERKLAQLRRDYAKKVSLYRKDYIHEIEMLRVEKQRKDEARLLAERAANEERRLRLELRNARSSRKRSGKC